MHTLSSHILFTPTLQIIVLFSQIHCFRCFYGWRKYHQLHNIWKYSCLWWRRYERNYIAYIILIHFNHPTQPCKSLSCFLKSIVSGVYMDGGSTTIIDCTISGNTATDGGGGMKRIRVYAISLHIC